MMNSMINGTVESSNRTPAHKEVNMIDSDIQILKDQLEDLEKEKSDIEERIAIIEKEIKELEEEKEREELYGTNN